MPAPQTPDQPRQRSPRAGRAPPRSRSALRWTSAVASGRRRIVPIPWRANGAWRSPVGHSAWGRTVGCSNPVAPTQPEPAPETALAWTHGLVQDFPMARRAVWLVAFVLTVRGVPLAGAASAATVSVELPSTLVFTAAAGESNNLNVHMDGALVVFHDSGAPVALGEHFLVDCNQPDQNTVTCNPGQSMRSVRAELLDGDDQGTLDLLLMAALLGGEGNDTLTVSTSTPAVAPVEARGEVGNDTITAGRGDVLLYGGPGEDLLTAGTQGVSLMHGDAGNDRLIGSVGREVLVGDAGADTIAAAAGDDQIFGDDFGAFGPFDPGPDNIDAGPGTDNVDAGGGNDIVMGGPGPDTLTGGIGDDQLEGAEDADVLDGASGNDTLNGGAGRDTDRRDRVHIDCETIERPVRCPARWRSKCSVSATLSTTGRRATVLGRGSARIRRGRTRIVRVPLSPRAQGIVRRAKKIDVRLALRYRAGTHHRGPVGTTFSLHSKLPSPIPHLTG